MKLSPILNMSHRHSASSLRTPLHCNSVPTKTLFLVTRTSANCQILHPVWPCSPLSRVLLAAWPRCSAAAASWRNSPVPTGLSLPTCVRSVTHTLPAIPPVKPNTSRWDITAVPVCLWEVELWLFIYLFVVIGLGLLHMNSAWTPAPRVSVKVVHFVLLFEKWSPVQQSRLSTLHFSWGRGENAKGWKILND